MEDSLYGDFSQDEKYNWLKAGVDVDTDYEKLEDLTNNSITPEQFTSWNKFTDATFDDSDMKSWNKLKVKDPSIAHILTSEYEVTREDLEGNIESYIDAGILNPADIPNWLESGFKINSEDPSDNLDMKKWLDQEFTLDEAIDWVQAGYTFGEAAKFTEMGYTSPDEIEINDYEIDDENLMMEL